MTTPEFPASSPRALQAVIARIESSDNPFALRFEPLEYAAGAGASLVARIAALHGVDEVTGRVIASTSWGLFQIMGFQLWGGSNPYAGTFFAYCMDIDAQRLAFEDFLSDHGINYLLDELLSNPRKLDAFAAKYNGDAARYIPAMRAAAQALGY